MSEPLFDALIPVKPLAAAKRRTAPVLSAAARADLTVAMFDSVLHAASSSTRIRSVGVVTADPTIRALALASGVRVHDDCALGLNVALAHAVRQQKATRNGHLVVLLADLPWLHADAIDDFLARTPRGGIALASDQHGLGTSALAWSSPRPAPRFAFGLNSLSAHVALGSALQLTIRIALDIPAFRDVDTPEDVGRLADERPDFLIRPEWAA